jgi:sulfite reductase (ferredoxin)
MVEKESRQVEKRSKVEHIKEASIGLRGSIAEELADDSDHVSDSTIKLLKFHGTYQQDNRDSRKERRKQGLDKEYIFMVRNRIPGGKITARQFLGELDLADEFGDGTLRITTRQGMPMLGTRATPLPRRPTTLRRRLQKHAVARSYSTRRFTELCKSCTVISSARTRS